MARIKRIIEKRIILAPRMEMPDFPCFRVDLSNSVENLIQEFLKIRPNQNWLLLADYAAQSQQQLWTAWLLSQRAFLQNRALARSIDAEFLRYIAGYIMFQKRLGKSVYKTIIKLHGSLIYQIIRNRQMS